MPEINVSNLKNLMWDKVGIIRNKEGLTASRQYSRCLATGSASHGKSLLRIE